MRTTIATVFGVLLLALPAHAVSLLISGTGTFNIQAGDAYDDVVVADTVNLVMTGGAISQDLTLLDGSTADLSGGSITGNFETFNDAQATLEVQSGTATLDGNPVADGTTLLAADCPTCTLAATLSGGDPFNNASAIAQNGQVHIVASQVPEPATAIMVGFGLVGLALAGRRRALA